MDAANCDRLPRRAQQLVLEIEARLRGELEVRIHQPEDGPSLSGVAELRIFANPTGATAKILHVGRECAVHVLAHEILHAHRYVVLETPWLESQGRLESAAGSSEWASTIQNAVEHLFVIPAEVEMFPESAATWQGIFDRERIAAAKRPREQSDLELLVQWMVADLTVPAWPRKELFAEQLGQLGYRERARNLAARVKDVGPDKMALLSTVEHALGLRATFRAKRLNLVCATRCT